MSRRPRYRRTNDRLAIDRPMHTDHRSEHAERDGGETVDRERGVSALVGFIFVFAALVITMSVVQATLVPQQNHAVEVDHSLRVQSDMQSVRAAIVGAFDQTGPRSVPVQLGTTYPSRLLFVNPVPATGTLESVGFQSTAVTIENASASGDVGEYWNGTDHRFDTRGISYSPGYNHYDDAPTTVYENSVLYDRFSERAVPRSSQTVIDGRTISLVTVNGSVSANGIESHSLDVRPVSVSEEPIAVEGESGNVTISLPTRLSASTWTTLLDGEFVANGSDGHVVDLGVTPVADSSFDRLTIELESGVVYDLRLARIGIGSGVTAPEMGYVVTQQGSDGDVSVDGEERLVAAVRDGYASPLSGRAVTFVTDDGTFADGGTETVVSTDPDGRASVAFSPSEPGTATVVAGFDSDGDGSLADEPARFRATFEVEVRYARTAYALNDPTDVTVESATVTDGRGNDPTLLDVTVENVAETTYTVDRLRVGHYQSAESGRPANWSVTTLAPGPHEITGPYVPLSPTVTLQPGESRQFEFEFLAEDGTNYDVDSTHLIFISVRLEDGGVRTYAVQPADEG